MFNDYLKAFIRVAEVGSITAASKSMYISPTGVMKQLNQLEKDLGFTLFIRSHKGLELTEAGRSFYDDAKFLIRSANESINNARQIQDHQRYTLRIATSIMNQDDFFNQVLQAVQKEDPSFNFSIVTFDDQHSGYVSALSNLDSGLDLIANINGLASWSDKLAATVHLKETPLCIAMNRNNKLANHVKLEPSDLGGQNIYAPWPGDSRVCSALQSDLAKQKININWIPTKSYDLSLLNQCANTKNLLLTPKQWVIPHPLLKPIPVNWPYHLDLSFSYSHSVNPRVKRFLEILKELNIKA